MADVPAPATPPAPAGWPLERKLSLLISALLAGVVGAFGLAAYHQVRAAAVDRATDRLESLAGQLAASSAASGAQRAATLRALAADSAVLAVVAPGAAPNAPALVERLRARLAAAATPADTTLDAWEVWAADGVRRAGVGAALAPADSLALAAARAAALRTDSVQRSPLYAAAGRAGMWTAAPVRAGGRTVGVLAERRHLAASPRTAQMIRQLTGEDVTVLLTSRGAGGVPGAGQWVTATGLPVPAPFALPAAGPGVREVRDGRDPRGAPLFVAQAAVPQSPWVVVLAESQAAVLRRPHEFLQALAGVGLLVLAGGTVGAWLLGRHVARPLGAVTGAAEALAGGDYARRVPVRGGAEVARLAATFNTMAARVGEAHASLAERNAALVRANAAKAQFLAMMSHELRTPLNAIGGYTELLELGLRGPVTPGQVEDLGRIRRSKDHLLSIITDLLNFARADAGHLTLALAPVPVGEVLADAEAALAHQFAARGVGLDVAPAPPDAVARADREKLQQVVLNLLTNALRFTPAGGLVTVAAAAEGDRVRVAVRDTGVGIPTDRHAAIFEPFVQVDAGLTRRVGGTGLGLAIVRTLVEAMDGEVAVESAPGAGSTFTVTLPRAAGVDAGVDAGRGTPGAGQAAVR